MKDVIQLIIMQSFSSFIMNIITSLFGWISSYIKNYSAIWCRLRGYVYYEATSIIVGTTDTQSNITIKYIHAYLRTITHKGNMTIIPLGAKDTTPSYIPTNWTYVEADKIWFKYTFTCVKTSDIGHYTKTTTYEICGIGNDRVNAFIQKCVDYYDAQMKATIIEKKLLILNSCMETAINWTQHDFESTCAFDQLFFPQKDLILFMINRLNAGTLRRLTILLSGEPGCGKTSIIKAIINLTKRVVYDIKLSKIHNANQLHNVFFSQSPYTSAQLPYKNRICLIEEIDTAGKLVAKREDAPKPKKDDDDEKENKVNIMGELPTLGDLLITFDGVLELSGMITIITTNHPEKLDPALIREGRIQIHCELKPCLKDDAIKIIKKHHCDYDEVTYPLDNGGITPARLEAFCEMSETVDDLNKKLVGKWIQ